MVHVGSVNRLIDTDQLKDYRVTSMVRCVLTVNAINLFQEKFS